MTIIYKYLELVFNEQIETNYNGTPIIYLFTNIL
jgi:hypothetical protein